MFALIGLLIILLCYLALGLIVLLKNRRNFTNISFAIFTFIMALWVASGFYSHNALLSHLSYRLSLDINRTMLALLGIGLYFLFLFCLEFSRIAHRYFRQIAIIAGLIILGASSLCFTPQVVAGIAPSFLTVVLKFGPLIWVYLISVISLSAAIIVVLALSIFKLHGPAQNRAKIMTISLLLSLSAIVTANLILPIVFKNYSFILGGLLASSIMVVGFTYAIVRHGLFFIRIIVTRSIAYLMVLVALGASYAFISIKIGGALFKNSRISTLQQIFGVFATLVLALTFQPLKHLFEKITDKIFYRHNYDSQKLINDVSHILASEIGLVELSHKVRQTLVQNIRARQVNIVVLDDNKLFVESGQYQVSRLEGLVHDLGRVQGDLLVTEEQPEGQQLEILHKYGISVMAVLRTQDEKIGYLLFGEKLNGDIYTGTDIRVITTIADELALAIQNARAYVQIQQFNQTLQAKVNDATKQLRQANNTLQQLDQVKDEFISIASHQLRTPLTIVDGYLANILEGIYGSYNDRQKQTFKLIQNRVRLTGSLVTDMLDLSRMEAGRFFIDNEPVDLGKIVPEEIELLKLKAKDHETNLIYSTPPIAIPILNIDEQKTRQVIMNLIDNAITYTPKGTVTVSLETVGNQVMFKVIDNGIGVPDQDQARLFNKFFRAANAKRLRPDGTGIGLYLVKRIIEQQAGTIIFNSKIGGGSTFGFRIPVLAETLSQEKPLPQPTVESNPNAQHIEINKH